MRSGAARSTRVRGCGARAKAGVGFRREAPAVETRSSRRIVEEVPNAETSIWPGAARPSRAQRGRGEQDTDLRHEALAESAALLATSPKRAMSYGKAVSFVSVESTRAACAGLAGAGSAREFCRVHGISSCEVASGAVSNRRYRIRQTSVRHRGCVDAASMQVSAEERDETADSGRPVVRCSGLPGNSGMLRSRVWV